MQVALYYTLIRIEALQISWEQVMNNDHPVLAMTMIFCQNGMIVAKWLLHKVDWSIGNRRSRCRHCWTDMVWCGVAESNFQRKLQRLCMQAPHHTMSVNTYWKKLAALSAVWSSIAYASIILRRSHFATITYRFDMKLRSSQAQGDHYLWPVLKIFCKASIGINIHDRAPLAIFYRAYMLKMVLEGHSKI